MRASIRAAFSALFVLLVLLGGGEPNCATAGPLEGFSNMKPAAPVTERVLEVKKLTGIEEELAVCAELRSEPERLECFDHLTQKLGLEPKVTSSDSSPGAWTVEVEQSKVDDSQNTWLILRSNESVPSQFSGSNRADLNLRCMENRTSVLIWFASYSLYSEHHVTTRIDKRSAQSLRWTSSNDNEWGFHPNAIAFIRQLATGKRLYVRTEPINHGPVEFSFDLTGLAGVLPKLQAACHWE